MALIEEEDREILEKRFRQELENDVKILLFTQEECDYCEVAKRLVSEVSSLSDKLKPSYHDIRKDRELASRLGVDKTPAILLLGDKEYKVRFFGLPSGYEFVTFIEDIVDVSRGATRLSPKTKEIIRGIDRRVHIQVFVTPSCPYCPRMVRLAHQFAIENTNIEGDMIEVLEFRELAEKYNVLGVPKTVVNDKIAFEGAVPEPIFVQNILKASKT